MANEPNNIRIIDPSPERDQHIYDFLRAHQIGVLATVDQGHAPYATTIYFSVTNDFNICFTTKRDTRKHENLEHNPNAMIVVYEAFSQTTVQIAGAAEPITDQNETSEVFKKTLKASMQTSNAGVPPISKLFAGNYIAYRIKPRYISLASFVRPDPGGYDVFETINFKA